MTGAKVPVLIAVEVAHAVVVDVAGTSIVEDDVTTAVAGISFTVVVIAVASILNKLLLAHGNKLMIFNLIAYSDRVL